MDQSTHEVRKVYWSNIIKQCQNRPHNLTAKAWLQQNNISEKSYYYWQRKFRNESFAEMASTDSTAVVAKESNAITFAEIPVHTDSHGSFDSSVGSSFHADAIIQSGSLLIGLNNSASAELIAQILQGVVYVS